jgi:hypothetical protein
MPVAFDRCVANGGRIRTKDVGKDKYLHICFLKGKSYAGEVKTKKSASKPGKK